MDGQVNRMTDRHMASIPLPCAFVLLLTDLFQTSNEAELLFLPHPVMLHNFHYIYHNYK